MTCFELVLAYSLEHHCSAPTSRVNRQVQREIQRKQQQQKQHIDHLCKHATAASRGSFVEGTTQIVIISACDLDAVSLLRDMPSGVYCLLVRRLFQNDVVYSNWKATQKTISPPRDSMLKQVYWAASKLEREMSRHAQ